MPPVFDILIIAKKLCFIKKKTKRIKKNVTRIATLWYINIQLQIKNDQIILVWLDI